MKIVIFGFLAMAALWALTGDLQAQAALPIVDDANGARLQDHCRNLLKASERAPGLLPDAVGAEVRRLLSAAPTAETSAALQRLLDRHCLIGVSINPESRVKAARGPALAELQRARETFLLVKIHNDAGVTTGVHVDGPHLHSAKTPNGWLEAKVVVLAPLRAALSGDKVEYVVLKLKAREKGKREATLQFDVGQGTQDLGFRAEVPVLFHVQGP